MCQLHAFTRPFDAITRQLHAFTRSMDVFMRQLHAFVRSMDGITRQLHAFMRPFDAIMHQLVASVDRQAGRMAPAVGLEPTTRGLTVRFSGGS
jgi:hypothetical protein